MTKRKRTILMSVVTLLLCVAVAAGGTYALFTDDATVENHLVAGKLDITLTRIRLDKYTLNGAGYLYSPDPDTNPVDFSNKTNENIFGFDDYGTDEQEKIVPGSKFVATLEVKNNSDVAFGYYVDVVCKDKKDGEDLAKQVKITVNSDDNSAFVGEGLTVKGPNGYISAVEIGKSSTFVVTVEFVDSHVDNTIEDNNLAQGEKVLFDLVVTAVQLTQAPANP